MRTAEELSIRLEQLGQYLERLKIIRSAYPIQQACRDMKSKDTKRCHIKNLELKTLKGDYIRGDWDSDLFVKLTIDVTVSDTFCFNDVKKIIINLEYSALHNDDARECKGAWHFDYHVDMEGTGEPENYRVMHPHYHVHHGGHRVKDIGTFGDMIVLKTPRLMHHPLDALLAIDLALSNFLPIEEWKKVRADTNYRMMMGNSQKNWWQPYYEELGRYWASQSSKKTKASKDNITIAKELNPHLM